LRPWRPLRDAGFPTSDLRPLTSSSSRHVKVNQGKSSLTQILSEDLACHLRSNFQGHEAGFLENIG
jgi:hypothetical protein